MSSPAFRPTDELRNKTDKLRRAGERKTIRKMLRGQRFVVAEIAAEVGRCEQYTRNLLEEMADVEVVYRTARGRQYQLKNDLAARELRNRDGVRR